MSAPALFEMEPPVGGLQHQVAKCLYESATKAARDQSAHVVDWEKVSPYFQSELMKRAADLIAAFDIRQIGGRS